MSDEMQAAIERGKLAYRAAVKVKTAETPEAERARCLEVALDCLVRGPAFPASKEFADGYSLAAQEIAAGIRRPEGKD